MYVDNFQKMFGYASLLPVNTNLVKAILADALKESYAGLEQKVEARTEELTASELRYRDLFEESRDAIFITSPEGRFIDVNRADGTATFQPSGVGADRITVSKGDTLLGRFGVRSIVGRYVTLQDNERRGRLVTFETGGGIRK